MHPIERIGTWLVGVLEYAPLLFLGLFLLYCVYCVLILHRMRGSTLEGGSLFHHPRWPITIRYPPWWSVQVAGDAVVFDSHEKDGVLRLTCRAAEACREDEGDLVRAALDDMRLALDDPAVRPLRVNAYPGAHASGFADRVADERPADAPPGWSEERCYAAVWAFRGPRTIAEFRYECSVLFGIVDGYYHDLMMPTLRLDDASEPVAHPDTAAAHATAAT